MKERRGNALDLFFILLLVFSLLGVIGRLGETGSAVYEESEAIMLVRVEASDAALFECLSLGEPLYLASGEYYGEVAAIDSAPAKITLLEDGVFLLGEWDEDGPRDYLISVKTKGAWKGSSFFRSERDILLVGAQVTLYGERAVIKGRTVEVSAPDA